MHVGRRFQHPATCAAWGRRGRPDECRRLGSSPRHARRPCRRTDLAATKAHNLMAARMFFRNCQEWIPRRFLSVVILGRFTTETHAMAPSHHDRHAASYTTSRDAPRIATVT